MPTAAVGLLALAAVAHATWNLATKRASRVGPVFVWMSSLISAILYGPLGIFVLVTSQTRLDVWLVSASVSGIIHAGYLLLLQRGYAIGDISLVYPLARGTGPTLSVVFAILLFSESPGTWGMAGGICIIAGVVVISVSGIGSGRRLYASIGIGAMTGAMIAGYTLWDAHAVTNLAVTPLALTWGASTIEALVLVPVALRNRRMVAGIIRTELTNVLAVGVLAPIAYILVLAAMRLAPVSLVAPGREISIVLVSLCGWLIFNEPNPRQRLVGSGIVMAGVAILGAS